MLGIYIHIPFCNSKCFYCDFYSETNCNFTEKYIEALLEEILSQVELLGEKKIDSIYIGGGTPSSINENYIIKILDVLKLFMTDDAEVTIEVNPETVTYEKLETYIKNGINRLSIGLQTINDTTLNKIVKLAEEE